MISDNSSSDYVQTPQFKRDIESGNPNVFYRAMNHYLDKLYNGENESNMFVEIKNNMNNYMDVVIPSRITSIYGIENVSFMNKQNALMNIIYKTILNEDETIDGFNDTIRKCETCFSMKPDELFDDEFELLSEWLVSGERDGLPTFELINAQDEVNDLEKFVYYHSIFITFIALYLKIQNMEITKDSIYWEIERRLKLRKEERRRMQEQQAITTFQQSEAQNRERVARGLEMSRMQEEPERENTKPVYTLNDEYETKIHGYEGIDADELQKVVVPFDKTMMISDMILGTELTVEQWLNEEPDSVVFKYKSYYYAAYKSYIKNACLVDNNTIYECRSFSSSRNLIDDPMIQSKAIIMNDLGYFKMSQLKYIIENESCKMVQINDVATKKINYMTNLFMIFVNGWGDSCITPRTASDLYDLSVVDITTETVGGKKTMKRKFNYDKKKSRKNKKCGGCSKRSGGCSKRKQKNMKRKNKTNTKK